MKKKTMEQIISENHKKGLEQATDSYYAELLRKRIQEPKRENFKNGIIVGVASMLIIFLMAKALIHMDNEAMENCMANGYSENVCAAVVQ